MQILSRENKGAILGAVHLKTETVDIPEWGDGVSVIVTEMSGAARDQWLATRDDKKSPTEWAAELLVLVVVDQSGSPVLDASDIASLRAQSGVSLDRIVKVAARLNGLGGDAVEDAAKNSEAAPSGASGSASQPVSVAQ